MNKIKTAQQKLGTVDWHRKQRKLKKKLYLPVENKSNKAQTGKQNYSKVPSGE